MKRHLFALGLAAVAVRVLAQDYGYENENGSAWNGGPPSAEYDQGGRANVDVDIPAPDATVTIDTFREGLAPYGEWVDTPAYGRAWRPTQVPAGWRPYYNGRWEWTDEGWLWVSDEPWGWAAYHYGRWAHEPRLGWIWTPGFQWAPAWVSWRYSPEYVGWAPLAPGLSVYVSSYPVSFFWWSFVPCTRFVGYPVHSYAYSGGYVSNIYHATRPAPPRALVFGAVAPAWGGPARPFLEHRVGRPITPVRIQAVASPGALHAPARAGVVPVYRPELRVAARPVTPSFPGAAHRSGSPAAAAPGPGQHQGAARGFAPPQRAERPQGFAPPRRAEPSQGVAPPPRSAPGTGPGHALRSAPGMGSPSSHGAAGGGPGQALRSAPGTGGPATRGPAGGAPQAHPQGGGQHGGHAAPAPGRRD